MKIYSSITDRLKSQHHVIYELIKDLDNNLIEKQPAKDKWSIKDNIAHIAYYHLKFLDRMELILNGKENIFKRYNPDEDPEFIEWRQMNKEELLSRLESNRKKVVDFIGKLKDTDFEKTGTHQKFGKMNIVQWIEFFLLHEAHHIYTIFRLARSN
ncbi:MAG: DinB family protein [Ignavibacteriaceae bacterium]